MWEDPIVEEVRNARRELEEECNNDFDALLRKAKEIQDGYPGSVISTPLRTIEQREPACLNQAPTDSVSRP